jgi:hypothetical protein
MHRNPSSRRQMDGSKVCSHKKVAVFLRIRPPPQPKNQKLVMDNALSNSTIEILDPTNEPGKFPTRIRTYPPTVSNFYRVNINRQSRDVPSYAKEFGFDCIMGPDTSQKTVYSAVVAPMVQDLLQLMHHPHPTHGSSSRAVTNESALLFSYGITNAGKTHTILGDLNSDNQSNWGIIPRAISEVFDHIRLQATNAPAIGYPSSPCQSKLQLYVSYFEIYNEQVYDLIPSQKTVSKYPFGNPPPLKVRECRGETLVRGLAKQKVDDTEHGIELTKLAHNKRHTSSNNINSDSSRSHFVCQMQIVQTFNSTVAVAPIDDDEESTVTSVSGYTTDEEAPVQSRQNTSTIWIVDLAGSERSKRTQVGSMRQKESTQINKSLMTLMRCLNTIKENSRHGGSSSIVPFRESKLTHIFMSHLTSSSAARTAIMVNVNPGKDDFDETQHVLAYATKAKLIEMDPEEYNRKRKQYSGEEYDLNGRKKVKPAPQKTSPKRLSPDKKPTLLSRVAKKLSPMRVFQKTSASSKPMSLKSRSSNSASDRECEALISSLHAAHSRIESLESENSQLVEELEIKEDLIRSEVALEMEERLRETRRKHREKYEQLQAQLGRKSSKVDFTVKMHRAESQLEELMDKVDECEKEMIRMNQDHHQEVDTLELEISHLKGKLAEAIVAKQEADAKIESLEKELTYCKRNHQKRKKQMTPQTKNPREDEDVMEEENIPTEPFKDDRSSSCEPLKFTLSVTKKAYHKKPRQRKPLRSAAINTSP